MGSISRKRLRVLWWDLGCHHYFIVLILLYELHIFTNVAYTQNLKQTDIWKQK